LSQRPNDAVPLKRRLPNAVTLTLTLLIVGAIVLGAAIRRGEVVPPTLDLELGIVRIVAYTTHYPECPPYTQCPPQSVAPPQAFYVVWSIYEPATAEQAYGRTARRVLVMGLNPR
jgi:hypothetical protein